MSEPKNWRRFEFEDASANSFKFWRIGTDRCTAYTHYGRLGTDGQREDKTFINSWECDSHVRKKIKEKLGKGYREVTSGVAVPVGTLKPKAKKPRPEKPPKPTVVIDFTKQSTVSGEPPAVNRQRRISL